MLNYKRLVPRTLAASVYAHNNEKLTDGEANKINDGSFIEDATSVNGECITAQEVNQKLSQENKHVNYMIGGDDTNELVCYYTWSTDTIEPTNVYIPNLSMTVEDRKLLAYEITPSNADVTSADFSITSGSDIVHIDDSYVVADAEGSATYKVVINGSIEATANITVSSKPEEFPDDAEHRWIEVEPKNSVIPAEGGTITVTGSYGLTGTYGTKKKVGDISDTITVQANTDTTTKSGSKTYYYNNNQFDTPTADISWTQEAHAETYTYTYSILIGKSPENIQEKILSFVWQSDQYGESNKEQVYVRAIKNKVNESGEIVEKSSVSWGTRSADSDKFYLNNYQDQYIDVYPTAENSNTSKENVDSIQIYIVESDTNYCTINLIQTKQGIKVVSGDAVMFTYNWTTGRDLDQATYVITNSGDDDHYNYAGYYGRIDGAQKNFLYFAGDNTGLGNEYAFVDFKSIAKWLEENGDKQSSISGKTILEANTDSNGLISIECDLYTVWYNAKEDENITLSYTVYDKDSDAATVTANSDKTFTLTGYTERTRSSSSALCYAHGTRLHSINPDTCYTMSAKFVYYFNSGVFVFETNDGNVGKWQKGYEYTTYPTTLTPTVTLQSFNIEDDTVAATASIQNLNLPKVITLSEGDATIDLYYYKSDGSTTYIPSTNSRVTFNSSTSFPIFLSTTVSATKIQSGIGSGTFEIYPYVTMNSVYDDQEHVVYKFNNADFSANKKSITV